MLRSGRYRTLTLPTPIVIPLGFPPFGSICHRSSISSGKVDQASPLLERVCPIISEEFPGTHSLNFVIPGVPVLVFYSHELFVFSRIPKRVPLELPGGLRHPTFSPGRARFLGRPRFGWPEGTRVNAHVLCALIHIWRASLEAGFKNFI